MLQDCLLKVAAEVPFLGSLLQWTER